MNRSFLGLTFALALALAPAPAAAQPLELPDHFSTKTLAAGLEAPTAIALAPDGRVFVAEKTGRLRVVSATGNLLSTPVLDISNHVNNYQDRGMLGIALDSGFATNGFVYLLYTYDADPANPSGPKTSRLTRIRVFPDNSVANSDTAPETVLLGTVGPGPCPPPADAVDCIPSDGGYHSIGTVRADDDGTIWVGSGDGSNYGDASPAALRTYDEQSMAGKILHVDREGRGLPGHGFCPGQPDLGLVCTKVHAKGLRNPFRFYLGPSGSPVVGDVGWGEREELDIVQKGGNYGWPCWEGSVKTAGYSQFAGCQIQYGLAAAAPAYEYAHGAGAAVQAGPRYGAKLYPPQYRGWFFADFVQGFIKLFDIDDQDRILDVRPFATGYQGTDLELAPNGDLVYTDIAEGTVNRIVYDDHPPDARAMAAPAPGGSAVRAPSVSLRRPSRRGTRSLGGRLLRSPDRLRVEVALRTRGSRCRSWLASRGTLGDKHAHCDRPRWMRASLTPAGRGTWLWRARLRGPLPRGSYVVSTRAVDARGYVLAGVRSTLVRIR